jgi:GABA permease
MAWKKNVLVVANVTAASDELVQAMKDRAAREPVSFMLLVPATPFGGGRAAARNQLTQACERLRGEGIEIDGIVGNSDPCVAVTEAWDPKRYDEIIVATLPMRFSKWLHAGLPERIERLTGAPVTHVVAKPKHEVEAIPAAPHERPALGPLTVLGWGGHREGG